MLGKNEEQLRGQEAIVQDVRASGWIGTDCLALRDFSLVYVKDLNHSIASDACTKILSRSVTR